MMQRIKCVIHFVLIYKMDRQGIGKLFSVICLYAAKNDKYDVDYSEGNKEKYSNDDEDH